MAIVVLVNVKIFISTNTHTFLSLFWQIGSVSWFFAFFFILDFWDGADLQGFLGVFLGFITNYVILFLFMSGFVLVDLGVQYVNDEIQSQIDTTEQLESIQLQERIAIEKKMRGRKVTQYRHHGFDFAGAAGHDVLITDNIINRIFSAFQQHLDDGPQIFGVQRFG